MSEADKPDTDAAAAEEKPAKRQSRKQRIAELEGQVAELQDKVLRGRADLDNFRKRAQRDVAEARRLSRIDTIEAILPVFDHFQMAMQHADENADLDTLRDGMNMILGEFERSFGNLGVERIPTVGEPFDPNLHEAISAEPSTEVPEQHVLREWKAGYRLGERLLRAASVVVSLGPPAAE